MNAKFVLMRFSSNESSCVRKVDYILYSTNTELNEWLNNVFAGS